MTLLLIVIIVFLIVWWKDSSDKKAKHEQHKQSTITNLQLEKEIRADWIDVIDKELKENSEGYAPLEHLFFLYGKYSIPTERWDDNPNKLEQDKSKILQEFKKLNERFTAIVSHRDKGVSEEPIYITPSSIYNLCAVENGEERVAKFETAKREGASCWATDLNTCIKICKDTISNYNYIMYSFTARARYSDLIKLLTKKSLKEKGFNPCPYGLSEGKESSWQETAKRQARLEEEKKKFPWL